MSNTVRIGSANTGSGFLKANTVDYRLGAKEALDKVDHTIGELEALVEPLMAAREEEALTAFEHSAAAGNPS